MLDQDQRDRFDVVLVSPRNPLNIGAAARAMANFGFARLTVAGPYSPNWREARSAVGAEEILQNAQEAETLAGAVAACTLVAGTGTVTHRKPEQPVVNLPALAPMLERELARGGRVALVFGQEKHGLTREDLSFCHVLVEIPTDPRQPSMNLGQAVAVCLYELGGRETKEPSSQAEQLNQGFDPAKTSPAGMGPCAAPSAELDRLAGLIEETMLAAHYSPPSMRAANGYDLRLMLRRLALSSHDTRRILGLFRRILWRLARGARSAGPKS
jgi:tRNA/rRNA methyltransferase